MFVSWTGCVDGWFCLWPYTFQKLGTMNSWHRSLFWSCDKIEGSHWSYAHSKHTCTSDIITSIKTLDCQANSTESPTSQKWTDLLPIHSEYLIVPVNNVCDVSWWQLYWGSVPSKWISGNIFIKASCHHPQ